MIRVSAALLLTAVTLGACDAPLPAPLRSQAQADASTVAACRQRANQIYDQQNRGAIYSPQNQANTPFSANWTPDVPNRGLSAQFGFDRSVNDCIRNTGTGTDRNVPQGNASTAGQPPVGPSPVGASATGDGSGAMPPPPPPIVPNRP
jgi:hypothetical protein